MYLKKMEIQGFKSFAEHVNIEFHDGITCIVGPNGSGKSNISDALKWVLGEQSPKTLRGSKMEDVIFSGTSTRKSRGMAEVTLVLDNTTNVLPIDFSEVSITRRMYRSGESEYYINNNMCRLKDIRELIMDTGIGVDGYSIIGQGKIVEIINSRPEERRKILEEVAGIVKYRTKKNEAERKLNATHQNLLRVNDVIEEIETRLDPLRQESDKAKEYLHLKETIKTIEIHLTLKNIKTLENRLQSYENELENIDSEMLNLNKKKADMEKDYVDHKIKSEELENTIQQRQERLITLMQEINDNENQKKINEERYTATDKDIKRIQEEIIILNQKIETESETKKQLEEKLESIKGDLSKYIIDQKDKTTTYNEYNSIINQCMEKVEDDKSKVIELHNIITAKNAEISSIDNLKNTLNKRKNQILSERETTQDNNNKIVGHYNELLKEKQSLDNKTLENKKNKENLQQQLKEKNQTENQITTKLETINSKLSEAGTRRRVLTDMENTYEGYYHAVKILLKNFDVKQGIHGVVADLVKVPAGYETAIETALGSALQNIICDNDESAKKAIAFLKKNHAGRLTFLPVNSIKAYKRNKPIDLAKMEGYRGNAVDIIEYDSVYSEIIEYLLGRVVIVDHLDNAVAMSKKINQGIRIVTIDGDVINSSGAMTGGSSKKNSGNILTRKAEANKLNEIIKTYKAEQKKYNELLLKNREEIKKYAQMFDVIEKEYKDLEMSLVSLDKEIHRLENDIKLYTDTEQKREKEIKDIESEEARTTEMISKLKEEIEVLRKEAAQIESTTQDSMKKYESDRQNIDKISDEITEIKLKVASLKQEKNNVNDNMIRVSKYITELTQEKESKEGTIQELDLLKETLTNQTLKIENEINQKKEKREILEEEKRKHALEREKTLEIIEKSVSIKEEMDKQIYSFQMKKHDIELKITKNETQIDSLKDKLWDEFEISYIQAIEYQKDDFKYTSAAKDAKEIRSKLKELGEVNVNAIKEYETVKERYDFLTEQRNDLLEAIDALKNIIEDMDKTIKGNFKTTFKKVAQHFEAIFKDLFGGGTAELVMEDENNLLETGIEIVAQPPGKKLQSISLLSGGEKTLTAISLMFAILKVKPTPFCIMDEVEAALDDANIYKFASYLEKFDQIQFVLVTHQKSTMEFADVLYGVTMPEQGISKLLSLKLEEKVS